MIIAAPHQSPVFSIVTVIDFKAGHDGAWADLTETLRKLQAQDFKGPVQCTLVQAKAAQMTIPHELQTLIEGTQVLLADGESSYDLKNAGARAARSDWVVILDADCPPGTQWLSALASHRARFPTADVISGRTFYRADGLLPRVLALLDRCYVDSGNAGPTHAISTNNTSFRRSVFIDHPMMNDAGPYGSKPHANKLMAAGMALHFEPDMLAYHAFGGWNMVRETRRQTGYSMAMHRKVDKNAKYASLYRWKELALPIIVCMSIADSCIKCVRFRKHYKIRLYELPFAWLVAAASHLLEVPGLHEGMHTKRAKRFIAYR